MIRWWRRSSLIIVSLIASFFVIFYPTTSVAQKIVIVIDPGHGGKDPGAIGQNGLREKDVNFAVARRLYDLLSKDPIFGAVLTRNGDYFISVAKRSDIARTKNANFLVSIHADAAKNNSAKGSSVWVLSNKRADSEMGRWLEQQEKQSELLGGGGDALSHEKTNPYLSQAVLDLQFAHSQRVGYTSAIALLGELKVVGKLHKKEPEHASFGILRSPDIPSVLVEVGFISNANEEKLLATKNHQNKLALSIYRGLRRYFLENPLQSEQKRLKIPSSVSKINRATLAVKSSTTATQIHVVKSGQTLFSLAKKHHSTVEQLRTLNRLKTNNLQVGQQVKVPVMTSTKSTSLPVYTALKVRKHLVIKGDSLSSIAKKYATTMDEIMRANEMATRTVKLGQLLIIP